MIKEWVEKELKYKIGQSTVVHILLNKSPVTQEIAKRGKEKYIEKYAGDIAKALANVEKNERKAIAKAIELLDSKISKDMSPELLLKIYSDLRKSQNIGVETTLEMIFTPEQVQKFENINQLIDETIQKKQTKIPTQIKVSRKIRSNVSPRTDGTPEEVEASDTSGAEGDREGTD
uniref:Uncharacterized protein n=1 Tax=viral metagenome TaxID=1070528 RepID=A0A6H1ZJG9_9ZZZZ